MARSDEPRDDERPRLQSLAQSARQNQLRQIRGTLIAIGILTIIGFAINLFNVPNEMRQAQQKGLVIPNQPGGPNVETVLLAVAYTLYGLGVLLGILYLILGALVHLFPVPITVATLVIYILQTVVCVVAGLGLGSVVFIIVRILFIIALARAVRTAFVYQREQRLQNALAEDADDEDEEDER